MKLQACPKPILPHLHFPDEEVKNAEETQTDADQLLPAHLVEEYQSLVGSELYISDCTRWDITFATNRACQKMSRPTKKDLEAAKRIQHYLRHKTCQPLVYKKSTDPHAWPVLDVYSDASHADASLGRSTAGYLCLLNGTPIAWKSKILPHQALSTCESEYMALALALQECLFVKQICEELHAPVHTPIALYCDNQAALQLVDNPVHHQRTKHLNAKYHLIRAQTIGGIVKPQWVSTKAMLADIFTKALPPIQHEQFVKLILSSCA